MKTDIDKCHKRRIIQSIKTVPEQLTHYKENKMHTASDQNISRKTLLVSGLGFVILIIFFSSISERKQGSPETPTPETMELNPNLQVILDQETEFLRNQQMITEIGWADILSSENLDEHGIPQKWYHVQLITSAINSTDSTQLNVFAPSVLSESDLMIRNSPDHAWRKQALIMKHTLNDKVFYFIPKQQLAIGIPVIDES